MIRATIEDFIYNPNTPIHIMIKDGEGNYCWLHGDRLEFASHWSTSINVYNKGKYIGSVPIRWLTNN